MYHFVRCALKPLFRHLLCRWFQLYSTLLKILTIRILSNVVIRSALTQCYSQKIQFIERPNRSFAPEINLYLCFGWCSIINSQFSFIRLQKICTNFEINNQTWREPKFTIYLSAVTKYISFCSSSCQIIHKSVWREQVRLFTVFILLCSFEKLSPTIESHRNENNFRHIREQICVSTRPLWNTS